MEEFDCKKCLHEKVCALWASRESQNASCFCTDGCDYFTPALTPPTQEQLERVWPGCSFCKNDGVQDYRTAVCVTRWGMSYLKGPEIESDDIFYAQNHFCRFCGRPLTLEAWKEMRKRWEAANDAD